LCRPWRKNPKGSAKTKQLEQAKTAHDFQAKVGLPITHDLRYSIKLNLIANCPVTVEDVDRAEKIYGPSLPILKDKTMRQRESISSRI
jgi:PII-like signaling protein